MRRYRNHDDPSVGKLTSSPVWTAGGLGFVQPLLLFAVSAMGFARNTAVVVGDATVQRVTELFEEEVQLVNGRGWYLGDALTYHSIELLIDPLHGVLACRREMNEEPPAVFGISFPLEKAGLFHAVQQSCHGARSDAHQGRQFLRGH